MAFKINLKDISKGGFTRRATNLFQDKEGFIYGTLKAIDLVESVDVERIKDKKRI